MVRHNNQIPNAHFHKHWQEYIKTRFDQPMKKIKRASRRHAKAARVFPRPPGYLRPIVRCPTLAYKNKVRLGRGFTLEELKEANIDVRVAKTIGVAVDHRRRSSNEEAFKQNVERLRVYNTKLLIFPRNPRVGPKKGDSSKEELSKAVQQKSQAGVTREKVVAEARPISDEEKKFSAVAALNKAREDKKAANKEWAKKLNKDRT
eukprot:TRINITY_DN243_c0_g1_i2.p1 TRINITY_DN243_c0_g1~~TRINITY_DN243_c0_g1_i2.p1  ORF type:complete len:204 (-),score=46.87 TRINITY_DN243_c0_g1_i2:135-746(-)